MIPTQNMPPVTKYLLMANIGVFVFALLIGPEAGKAFYYTFGLVPGSFWSGMFWQPVSSMFLHGGFLHLLVNMIALWSLGMLLEQAVGSRSFAYLYGVSGIAGGFFVAILQSSLGVPTVGASGAISGMLGAIAILYPESRLLLFVFPVKARTAAILLGAGSVLFAMIDGGGNISHMGHLGGLVGGLAFAYFALKGDRRSGLQGQRGPGWNPFATSDFGGEPRGPVGFDAERPAVGPTYYDPVRGVFFTASSDHALHRGRASGRLFDAEQISALRRIQRMLGKDRDRKDDYDEINGIRFHRPSRRYYH